MPDPQPLEDIAEGFLAIAVDSMANAIRKISVARGHDVTALCAGLLRRCWRPARLLVVADALGMETVLVHPARRHSVRLWHRPRAGEGDPRGQPRAAIGRNFRCRTRALQDEARSALTQQGIAPRTWRSFSKAARGCASRERQRARGRMRGSRCNGCARSACCTASVRLFRTIGADHRRSAQRRGKRQCRRPRRSAAAPEAVGVQASGSWRTIERASMGEGEAVEGRVLIIDPGSTTVVEESWQAALADEGSLILDARAADRARPGRRDRGRSGPAGDLQQPLHGDRRGNGCRAAIDRHLGQHQGAARFLLRAVRPAWRIDRQRAAYPGASRQHGRQHRARDRERAAASATGAVSGAAMPMCSTPLSRRHPSARTSR